MSGIDLIFQLFALLLGLSIAELLAGLARSCGSAAERRELQHAPARPIARLAAVRVADSERRVPRFPDRADDRRRVGPNSRRRIHL